MGRVTFQPFRDWFWSNHPTKKKLHVCKEANISWATVNKVFDDKTIQTDMIGKLCKAYDLKIEEIATYIADKEEK